jgi:nucleolar protein 58
VTALNEAAALTDGKVSSMLSNLLEELKDETKASRMYAPYRMRAIVLTPDSGRR